MDDDNPTVREDIGYRRDMERPKIKPGKIMIKYVQGISKGQSMEIQEDIARQMIAAGTAVEIMERQPGEEG